MLKFRKKKESKSLSKEEVKALDAYFRASNYLSVGQLYLLDNPLLKQPLKKEDIKKKIVGHWGTVPGQNFIYTHLNRIIKKYDLDMIYISGPGHGGNAIVSHTYMEGTYSEVYPNVTEDEAGMKKLFKQFSFPGGISSHVAPETPGSIHEGGELGYSLAHAFGTVFDHPSLVTACVIGDGEAETGPLATSWHSNKFLNPLTDGAVLPILHLNGYKISNPTVLARISHEELKKYLEGCGWKPYFVEGVDPLEMHEKMAETLDQVIEEIKDIQRNARENHDATRPVWPMIVFRSPKGWTGPKIVDQKEIEGTFRAHQVPITMTEKEHVKMLEEWLKSYHPEELFDQNGHLLPEIKALAPKGNKRMSANPIANGGLMLKELKVPDYKNYAIELPIPGTIETQDMVELGKFVRDILKLNEKEQNFRVFGPDETMSNRLTSVFEETNRSWNTKTLSNDEFLAPNGRIMDSYLSEHMCEGWLEGYLLSGRHGFFASYEAFARIVDSMFTQHAKWLKVTKELPWRKEIASLNCILSSNVWQQDHNGYTHQDPGFLNHIADKKKDIVNIYLPADANTLLVTFDKCIRSKNKINVMVTSKHPRPQWLTMDQAIKHVEEGVGVWPWASNDNGTPDLVLACAGDSPTLESLAAVTIMRAYFKDIKIRFINVVDLMKLDKETGLSDESFNGLFTKDKPIIFNFHGYPSLIYSLLYERENRNLKVFGYEEEGTITTPFDMRVQNRIDRYHLVIEMIKALHLEEQATDVVATMEQKLVDHKAYISEYGQDTEEIRSWKWINFDEQ